MHQPTSSSTTNEEGESRLELRRGPPDCSICSRPAHGHHYGVASCKGCKTFFRRMCVSTSDLTCKLNNDCFDHSKRVQFHLRCQACRYKKCIDVGMNPLALELKNGEDESPNYKKLTEVENSTISVIKSKEILAKQVVEMLTYLELKLNQLRMSAYNPTFPEYMKSTEELITRGSLFWLADELGPMKGWPINKPNNLPKVSRMRDVPDRKVMLSGFETVPAIPVTNEKMWMFFNMTTTIEYVKTFTFFHKLDLKDQIVLIGHVTLICMNLHNSYFAVSQKIQKCMQPDGTEQPQNDEYHFPVVSMSLAPLIRCNIQQTEYMLLKAICLCNPTIHGFSEHAQSIISKERQQFSDVLLDYCLRNRRDGPSRFAELIGIIPVLVQQQRLQKDIHIYHIAPIISKFPYVVQFLEDIMYA